MSVTTSGRYAPITKKRQPSRRLWLSDPLTDFYAFNGWALQFTTTPRAGLRDSWLTMRGNFAALEARAEYHRFRSAWGG